MTVTRIGVGVGVPMSASTRRLQTSTTSDEQVDGVNRCDNQQWTFLHTVCLN